MSTGAGELKVGQVLKGRYIVVAEGLTRDLGIEYKAYDRQDEVTVALLVLEPVWGSGVQTGVRLGASQERVRSVNEAALVPFQEVVEIEGCLVLVREYIEGRSLADLLAQEGRLDIRQAVEIAVGLGEALDPAHKMGLVHGGLSPHCVWLGDEGQVTVTDTGLLPALAPLAAPVGLPRGWLVYRSPEQAAGERLHPSSDVYAIGALLYEMLAGEPLDVAVAAKGLSQKPLRPDPTSLQTLVPECPLPLAEIVCKALSWEPAARYRYGGQLACHLRSQLGLEDALSPAAGPVPAAPPPSPATPPTPDTGPAPRQAAAPGGVDWVLVGLMVVALIAVLGLIPLWRVVYERYALPAPPPPVSHLLAPGGAYPSGDADQGLAATAGGRQGASPVALALDLSPNVTDSLLWESRLRSWGHGVLHCKSSS